MKYARMEIAEEIKACPESGARRLIAEYGDRLVEDVLDESLAGGLKRALDLHLSRCDACRTFFAAEKEEHSRWFRAMNEPTAHRNLPEGFTEDFIASLTIDKIVPQKRWMLAGMFRRIAAALAAMLLFAGLSYAAAVAVKELSGDDTARDFTDGNLSEMAGSPAAVQVSGVKHVSEAALSAEPFSNRGASLPTESHNHQTGDAFMNKAQTAVAALSVAIAAAPLAASYNSFAPHSNAENTDFWDTRGYDVEPESSASGVCSTVFNRLVCTVAVSDNVIRSFRRTGLIGMVITFR